MQNTQRTLIVLDVNKSILYRDKTTTKVQYRPHIRKLIEIAFRYFDVAIWTSAKKHNIEPILKQLFGDNFNQLRFVYYRNMCDNAPTTNEPYATTKNMNKLPKYERVIIVDDSVNKIKNKTPAMMHYCIYPWIGDICDDECEKLITYLLERNLNDMIDDLADAFSEV